MLASCRKKARTFSLVAAAGCGLLAALTLAVLMQHAGAQTTMTTTLFINGQSGKTYSGLHISTTSGPCITVSNSTNITIQQSNIGPCGDNNTVNDSHGIEITSNSSVNIYDNYIHVENLASNCGPQDSHTNVYIINNGAAIVNIQGNVIAYGQSNISVWDASNIQVVGNFLLNPRGSAACSNTDNLGGNQFHVWAEDATPNSNITVNNNYTLIGTGYLYPGSGSDEIGFGVTNTITAKNNYVIGAGGASACGMILDYKANSGTFTGNIVGDGGTLMGCGIGIGSGTNHVISGNKVLLLTPMSSAAGLTVTNYYSVPCSTISISSNYAYAIQPTWVQGYYDQGACTGVSLSGNIFDVGCTTGVDCQAYAALNPLATTNPPPLIPPKPYACVAASPYSTQTSVAACSGGTIPPPPPPPSPTASLTAIPTSILSGQSSTLSWSSTNATSCSGSGFTASGLSGSAIVSPSSTTTYGVTCSSVGGSAAASAQVSVTKSTTIKGRKK